MCGGGEPRLLTSHQIEVLIEPDALLVLLSSHEPCSNGCEESAKQIRTEDKTPTKLGLSL